MIVSRAPGKALLAGEYAVLVPGEPCLVAAVERRITASASPSDSWSVSASASDSTWMEGEPIPPELSFAVATVEAARRRWSLPPHRVNTDGAFELGGRKIGLGGSAAVTSAVAVALGRAASASRDDVDALAHAVHHAVQGKRGSGADVAASLNGGILRYVQGQPVARLTPHPDLRLLLAFSGSSAATAPRVARFGDLKDREPDGVAAFVQQSRGTVDAMGDAIESGDIDALRDAVRSARGALERLSGMLGAPIETEALHRASDAAFAAGGAGKSSGAGGGDCAVLFAMGDRAAAQVRVAVERVGLVVMDAPIAREGAHGS